MDGLVAEGAFVAGVEVSRGGILLERGVNWGEGGGRYSISLNIPIPKIVTARA